MISLRITYLNENEYGGFEGHSGISPTGAQIPRVFLQALNANYEDGRVSYKKLQELLGMWQKTPEEMGFQFAADYKGQCTKGGQ